MISAKFVAIASLGVIAGAIGPDAKADSSNEILAPSSRRMITPVHYYKKESELKIIARTKEAFSKAGFPSVFAAVGGVQSYFNGIPSAGGGTLVSPCDVLTSAHVVFGGGEAPSARTKVDFYYGQGPSGRFLTHVSGHPIAWGAGKNDGTRWINPMTCGNDWALVRLDNCPSNNVPYMKAASVDINTLFAANLVAVGAIYEGKYVEGERVDPSCNIVGYRDAPREIENSEYVHTCSSAPGASGSPLIMISARLPRIVALQCGVSGGSEGEAVIDGFDPSLQNLATPIEFFFKLFKKALRGEESYVNFKTKSHWSAEDSYR